ncbi:biliverdin-producing heme oxygenase [Moraxella catarrhalis]|uniref:biliverdin-producing heme oxygenase n=1 Tax=Moraxella catarrhalis TaxID=480 RepID=UPI0007E3801A|nr:biliverdin-producing heme oxygenase [Moraxella catarrhalis]OAV16073.1 Heme oxygenase HemO, associated with heme uptake [Moraxella catarrhalis]
MTQPTFTERLKEDTRNIHDSVDEMVMSVRPFDSVENYIKFLNLQSVFHKIVDPIYKDPALNQSIENLASMARYDTVLNDLKDLEQQPNTFETELPAPTGAKAIGWLYCAEGSNIGAAFLFKDTKEKLGFDENFGASHLDAHPDGRGKHWKAFRESLNQLNLSKDEQDTAIQGAIEAFEFYKVALKWIFG